MRRMEKKLNYCVGCDTKIFRYMSGTPLEYCDNCNLLKGRYPALTNVPREVLIDAVRDYASMDRAWRQALEKNSKFRGTDYGDKEALMHKKKTELGYE